MLNLDSDELNCRFLKRSTPIYKNGVFFFCYSFHQPNFFDVVLFQIRHTNLVFSLILCFSSFTLPVFEYFYLVLIWFCYYLHPKVACAFHKTLVQPQWTKTVQLRWFSPAPQGWEFVRPRSLSSWLMQITSLWAYRSATNQDRCIIL